MKKDSNNLNNSKSKDPSILLIVCIALSVFVAFSGLSLGISSIMSSFTMDRVEFFGPLLNLFVFGIGLSIIIYSVLIIVAIWIVFGIIKLFSFIYSKLSKTGKRIFIIVFITLISLILIVSFSISLYGYSNKNIMKVLNDPPVYGFYDSSTYYFIYKDKIYYYKGNSYSDAYSTTDRFYVMNLDGKNNKKLAETDELRNANFYFVYDDEAYYYTSYYSENKKINLKTGKITSLGTNDQYIPKTFNDGYVYSFFDNPVVGDEYSIFKKIDVKNNITISEVRTNESMNGKQYFFDYDGGNIFYLEDFSLKHPSIYKNNEIIYEFTEYNDRYKFPDIEFFAVNDDYIYFKLKEKLYKLDINTKTIEEDFIKDYDLDYIKRISSGNNSDNYFYSDNAIYSFDMDNDEFKLVLNNVDKTPEYVYNINNKLIFTENTDGIYYYSDDNDFGSVVVYNKTNKKTEKYNNIVKVCFDEKYMYLLYKSQKNYSVKKIKL